LRGPQIVTLDRVPPRPESVDANARKRGQRNGIAFAMQFVEHVFAPHA